MKINEVSDLLEIHSNTLRRWERQGDISSPGRTTCGYRDYGEQDIEEILEYLKSKGEVEK